MYLYAIDIYRSDIVSKMSRVICHGFHLGQEPTPEFDQPENELGELGDLLGMEPLAKLRQ